MPDAWGVFLLFVSSPLFPSQNQWDVLWDRRRSLNQRAKKWNYWLLAPQTKPLAIIKLLVFAMPFVVFGCAGLIAWLSWCSLSRMKRKSSESLCIKMKSDKRGLAIKFYFECGPRKGRRKCTELTAQRMRKEIFHLSPFHRSERQTSMKRLKTGILKGILTRRKEVKKKK